MDEVSEGGGERGSVGDAGRGSLHHQLQLLEHVYVLSHRVGEAADSQLVLGRGRGRKTITHHTPHTGLVENQGTRRTRERGGFNT